jgi:hypothetical protein
LPQWSEIGKIVERRIRMRDVSGDDMMMMKKMV